MMKLLLLALMMPFAVLARYDSTRYVAAKNGLSLRTYQSTSAPIILKIGYGEKVVFAEYDSSLTIEGFKTSWAKIRYKGKVGYVADVYLFEIPPPLPNTETAEKYFKQLSSLACPAIVVGSNDTEAEEEGIARIEKSIYKNGFEHHKMYAYEFGSSMYILPNLHLNSLFQVFRGIPEFKRFLNTSSPFPTASKKIDSNHKISVRYFVDDQGKEDADRVEKISFYADDLDICELEFFEKEGQVFVIFGEGV